jgi:predicted porin
MKKLLLGTSALVAAGLFSNGALAQTATTDQPIQMKFGGQYYAGAAAFISDDDNPGEAAYKRQPTAIQDYFLIRFLGSTTFSNGITAGVWTRLNAFSAPFAAANTTTGFSSSNNTWIKDSYAYLKSPVWGEFRIGDDSDVRRNDAVGNNAGVTGDGNIGANSGAIYFSNSPAYNFTTLNLDGRGTKLVYYSPTIMGFHAAASYTPDAKGGHTNGPGNIGDNNGPTDNQTNGLTPSYLNNATAYNYYSLAVGYNGTFGPTKVAWTAGYSTGSRKAACTPKTTLGFDASCTFGSSAAVSAAEANSVNNADPRVYNSGIQVNYGPFELGFDYELSQAIPGGLIGGIGQAVTFNAAGLPTGFLVRGNEMINKQFDLNLSYTVGAIRMGVEWSRGEFEGITGDADVKRAATNDVIQVGATYSVGPGVNVAGLIQQTIYDAGGAYVPNGANFTPGVGGVATNTNVYSKNFNSTALIMETSFRW